MKNLKPIDLLSTRSDDFVPFPLENEDIYNPRSGVENKLLNELTKREGKRIHVVKSENGNGNTSFLNYLALKMQEVELYLIGVRGENHHVLRSIYKKQLEAPPSWLTKIRIWLKCLGLVKGSLAIMGIVAIYIAALITVPLIMLAAGWDRSETTLLTILLIGGPWVLFLVANWISRLIMRSRGADRRPDYLSSHNSVEALQENFFKDLKETTRMTVILIDCPERLDTKSRTMLTGEILPLVNETNLPLKLAMVVTDMESEFMESFREDDSFHFESHELRYFNENELELIAKQQDVDISGKDLSEYSVASLICGLSTKEIEDFGERWKELKDIGRPIPRQAYMGAGVLARYDNPFLVPQVYLDNFWKFVEKFIPVSQETPVHFEKEIGAYHGDDYLPMMMWTPKGTTSSAKYDFRYVPSIIEALEKRSYRAHWNKGHLNYLWGRFVYDTRYKSGQKVFKIVKRFVEAFLDDSGTDFEVIETETRIEFLTAMNEALLEGGRFCMNKEIELGLVRKTTLEVQRRFMELETIQDATQDQVYVALEALKILLDYFFFTADKEALERTFESLLSKTRDTRVLDILKDPFMSFAATVLGRDFPGKTDESWMNQKDLPKDGKSCLAFVVRTIKEKNLWFCIPQPQDPQMEKHWFDFERKKFEFIKSLPIPSKDDISVPAMLAVIAKTHLLGASLGVYVFKENHVSFQKEFLALLRRFEKYKAKNEKLSDFEQQMQVFYEARLHHLLFMWLKTQPERDEETLKLAKVLLGAALDRDPRSWTFEMAIKKYFLSKKYFMAAGMKQLLAETYFHEAELRHMDIQEGSPYERTWLDRVVNLLIKAEAIEDECGVCNFKPQILFKRYQLEWQLRAESAKYPLKRLNDLLWKHGFPSLPKAFFGKILLEELHHFAAASEEYAFQVELATKYLKLLTEELTNDEKELLRGEWDAKFEELEIRLIYIVQGLKCIKEKLPEAQKHLHEIEKELDELPSQLMETKYLRTCQRMIQYDIMCSFSNTKKAEEYARELYMEMFNYWDVPFESVNLFVKKVVDEWRSVGISERVFLTYEYIKRMPQKIENDVALAIARAFLLQREHRVDLDSDQYPQIRGKFSRNYLEAGEKVWIRLERSPLSLELLRDLCLVAYRLGLVRDFEVKYLLELRKEDSDIEKQVKYVARLTELRTYIPLYTWNLIEKTDFTKNPEAVLREVELYIQIYAPDSEETPDDLFKLYQRGNILLSGGDAHSCYDILAPWYESFMEKNNPPMRIDIALLELLTKATKAIPERQAYYRSLLRDLHDLYLVKIQNDCSRLKQLALDEATSKVIEYIIKKLNLKGIQEMSEEIQ